MSTMTSSTIIRFLIVAAAVPLACDAQDESGPFSDPQVDEMDEMDDDDPEISDADGEAPEPSASSEFPETLTDFSDDVGSYAYIGESYILAPNKVSIKLTRRGCTFRVWYGNYISVPFAKLQMYGGDCAGWRTWVWSQNGNTLSITKDSGKYSGGNYGGEPYFGLQAQGPAPAYGVGQLVCDETGFCFKFWHN